MDKKRILILGKRGLAGSTIFDYLKSLKKYKVVGTTRRNYDIEYKEDRVRLELELLNYDVVVNCIGLLVKASEENKSRAVIINSYFPHWLEEATKGTDTKIIHLSTDCVFSGEEELYYDSDTPDATSFYGRTKALGELNNNKDLTIRMSIIGRELKEKGLGLFEWLMRQKGTIEGYNRVSWTGITTLELAKFIDKVITESENESGIYQLATYESISKYHLLKLLAKVWNKTDVKIKSNKHKVSNKTLVNTFSDLVYDLPNYKQMLIEYKEYLNE